MLLLDKPEVFLSREGRDGANSRDISNSTVVNIGDDVTLKCSITANPGHHTIVWTKQVNIITTSTTNNRNCHTMAK